MNRLSMISCVVVAVASGCSNHFDPCAGVSETCLALTVAGTGSLTEVDTLTISIDPYGAKTSTAKAGGTTKLPVAIAVELAALPSPTTLDVVVDGSLRGVVVGRGSAQVTVDSGQHESIKIALAPTLTSDMGLLDQSIPDGGSDADSGSCHDGVRDGDESDVDCGGSCALKCRSQLQCGLSTDCASGICTSGACIAASGPPFWVTVVSPWPEGITPVAQGESATGPDGNIYMFGGCSTEAGLATPDDSCDGSMTMLYSPSENTISTAAFMPHSRAGGSATLGLDGKIYLLNGFNYNTSSTDIDPVNAIDAYDPVANKWSSPGAFPSGTVSILWAPAVTEPASGLILTLGGYLYPHAQNPASYEVRSFDPASVATPVPTPMPESVYGDGAAVGSDGAIYALLGQISLSAATYNLMRLDPNTREWTEPADPMHFPTIRYQVGAAPAPDGRIFVVGGASNTAVPEVSLNTVEAYTPKTNDWAVVPSLNQGGMWINTVVGLDGRIYALGGAAEDAAGNYTFRSAVETYGPFVDLVSNHGATGSTQELTGHNFAANAVVSIYLGTSSGAVGTGKTDANGNLASTTYRVPQLGAGDYKLTVVDNRSDYPYYTTFTVN